MGKITRRCFYSSELQLELQRQERRKIEQEQEEMEKWRKKIRDRQREDEEFKVRFSDALAFFTREDRAALLDRRPTIFVILARSQRGRIKMFLAWDTLSIHTLNPLSRNSKKSYSYFLN